MSAGQSILDVGGRKSPYTIGIPVSVTIMEKPKEDDIQMKLNLGLSDSTIVSVQKKRSNIKEIILADVIHSSLAGELYDGALAIEVIEHVEEDELFVKKIAGLVKPGGWVLFTTPNGDYIKNEPPSFNPDHKRHYTKLQLKQLLDRHFSSVRVDYAVKTGRFRRMGIKSITLSKPLRAIMSSISNIINRWESHGVSNQATGTAHLIALARK
ncbi:MAG: methyltransferase domain-containing protein [Cyclobacteriaceae bacterium]|nr:methyltransferase domain-containing protein [Cyclobacteriaceae bacterium]